MNEDLKTVWRTLKNVPKPEPPTHCTGQPGFEFDDKWYVYVPGFMPGGGYLHKNGKIYENTMIDGNDYAGWFETKKDALAAIELYYKLLDF